MWSTTISATANPLKKNLKAGTVKKTGKGPTEALMDCQTSCCFT
jgi:hypothetical protein